MDPIPEDQSRYSQISHNSANSTSPSVRWFGIPYNVPRSFNPWSPHRATLKYRHGE